MRIQKTILVAAIGLLVLFPAVGKAASLTTDQVNAIVSLLQSFGADASTVADVQLTLSGQKQNGNPHAGKGHIASSTASTTPWGTPPGQIGKMLCIALNRNLGVGSHGDDVRKLQEMLAQDLSVGFNASSTGYFGPMTAKAMMRFQIHYKISSSTTGAVGPLTRGFFERSCGKGLGNTGGNPNMGATTAH